MVINGTVLVKYKLKRYYIKNINSILYFLSHSLHRHTRVCMCNILHYIIYKFIFIFIINLDLKPV